MRNFLLKRVRSFRYALDGWGYVLRTQPNTWIYTILTLLVSILAFYLQLSLFEWAILLLTFGMVWSAEFFNTAIETVVDLVSPKEHPLAKIGKDVGAAAVLLTAICSIMVGIFLLGPPLFHKVKYLFLR